MKSSDLKKPFPILEIAKINIQHNALLSIIVCIVIIILTPIIVGTANLDSNTSALPMEMFVSLIGIAILTPIFQPEQHSDINDLVSSKYINTTTIYIIRTIYSIIFLTIFISLFSVYMYIRHCDITLWLIIGTISDAIFLGSLGMIASSICNNTIIAYMVPTIFYALNYGMGSKLKNFYLFSMTMGQFTPKMWMLATGILLIITAILLKEIQKKFQ